MAKKINTKTLKNTFKDKVDEENDGKILKKKNNWKEHANTPSPCTSLQTKNGIEQHFSSSRFFRNEIGSPKKKARV